MRAKTGKEIFCGICAKAFYIPLCRIKIGRKYCGRKCGYKGRGQSNTGRTHFKKGIVPWNKGSKGLVLDKNYEQNLAKGRGWNRGMGMATNDTRLRWSNEYKRWRKEIFKRDNYTCQICREKGGRLNADHIKPFALYPKLRFELTNGRTLCVACHKKTDTYGKLTRKQKEEAGLLQVGT